MTPNSYWATLRAHADKWLFFALFLAGALLIVSFDAFHVPKLLAVIICTVLLFGYAFSTSLVPAVRLRPDQAADNSYYLGLLFTLTSLGVALFRFSTAENAADAILRNFGIAIATTIVGLGLRVFLSQFREDPDDLEYEAKTALAESVRALRGGLDQSLAEMQSFAVGAKQALQEVSEATSKSTLETLTNTVARFESAADDMGRRFEGTASSFEQRAGAFDGSLQKLAEVVEALSERIGAVRADSDMLEDGIRPAFDALQSRVSEFAATFEGEQKRLAKGLTALSALSESLAVFDQSAASLDATSQKLSQASSAIGESADSFVRLDQASRSAADAAFAYSDQFGKIADEQVRHNKDAMDALAHASDQLAQRANASLSEIDQSAQRVAAALTSLNSEFSGSSEAVQRVRRELAELAGWIIARLDAK
ncbi:hypothetical protein [Phenylobacterium sp.]|uniref:hypothetical protein n=1 Tax=Phenylobacterium sp. TaxID=1871053 RepID=UPI002737AAC0|nr:hypothetical protein [Phenylobacterium sp.]MDP3870415.1 hypothetical protein [Phenylobacterium sp.]